MQGFRAHMGCSLKSSKGGYIGIMEKNMETTTIKKEFKKLKLSFQNGEGNPVINYAGSRL